MDRRYPSTVAVTLTYALLTLAALQCLQANDASDLHLSEDLLPLTLTDAWRFRSGDRPEWALPQVDDQNWLQGSSYLDPQSALRRQWSGRGWFRRWLAVDSTMAREGFALRISHLGASEIYLNGVLLQRNGRIMEDADDAHRSHWALLPAPLSFRKGPNLIAVRYSMPDDVQLGAINSQGVGFELVLSSIEQAEAELAIEYEFGSLLLFVFGITFVMALLHFMIFLFNRQQHATLLFACAASGLSLATLANYQFKFAAPHEGWWFTVSAGNVCFAVFLLAFLYAIFYKRIPRVALLFWLLAPMSVAASWWDYRAALLFITLASVEALRIIGLAVARRREGAWLFGGGVITLVMWFFLFDFDLLGFKDAVSPMTATLVDYCARLTIPLLSAVFLARNYAQQNQQLQVNIEEVRVLSEQTIAQEREKQRLIESQKQHLEEEVAERTAEIRQQHDALQVANLQLEATLGNLKRTQAQLVQSEKLASLGELTAGVAHEMQNPLNFVNNFAELSQELVEEAQEDLEALRTNINEEQIARLNETLADLLTNSRKIGSNGARAANIVKGMLMHAAHGSGKRQEVHLNVLSEEAVKTALRNFRTRYDDCNIEVQQHLDAAPDLIELVPQDINRVLISIVDNACYAVRERWLAAPEGFTAMVTIETRRHEQHFEITIHDNGLGIPAEQRDKIFQPFYTTKPTDAGTGLGLSLAFDIVSKGHGGELLLESEPERGTAFIIVLPPA